MNRLVFVLIALTIVTLSVVSVSALTTSKAHADLVNGMVIVNAQFHFEGQVDDTAAAPPGSVVLGGGCCWSVVVSKLNIDNFGGANDIDVEVRHNLAHPGELVPNVTHPGTLFNVVPGMAAPPIAICLPHPNLGHNDCTNISYTPKAGDPGTSVLHIEADHLGSVGGTTELLVDHPGVDLADTTSGSSSLTYTPIAAALAAAALTFGTSAWYVRRRLTRR